MGPNLRRDDRGRARPRRIAAIDIGSNSIRQILADVSPDGRIQVVDEMKAAPRLGSGLADHDALDDAAIARALDALRRMTMLARRQHADRIEVVATSAVREAANGEAFAAEVRRATGLPVRVLSGDEEARLAFRSALAHFELGHGRVVVMDIGGGSLELALSSDGVVEHLASLPLGALRLTEQFLIGRDQRKGLARLRRHVRELIRPHLPVREWRGARLIGSGGTFTNLAGIHLARQGMTTARTVHGTAIPHVEVEHILELLADQTPAERRAVPGLNPGRADIILAGVATAMEVVTRLEARALQVSAYGIREGLLLEAARVTPTTADRGESRGRSVRDFGARCRYDAPHAEQVRALALALFDKLGAHLGCRPEDREILADAALLHDVGYHIGFRGHHKHSYHLIVHAELLGVSPAEQVMVANVARYHRGKRPRKQDENLAGLSPEVRKRVRRLAAILRVADGLDRGHMNAVRGVRVRWLRRAVRITPVPARRNRALRLEVWGAQRKSDLLARVAKRPVEIVAPDGAVHSSETADA
jgi:exopolyphosphatase / guanosine-5'-triphosphate,3'-diphosphate pyrophosphatase